MQGAFGIIGCSPTPMDCTINPPQLVAHWRCYQGLGWAASLSLPQRQTETVARGRTCDEQRHGEAPSSLA
eukprot:6799120-Pyramimonas_sp.AAC.1